MNTVFISAREDAASCLTAEQREKFKKLGLTKLSDLEYGESYIAVLNSQGSGNYEDIYAYQPEDDNEEDNLSEEDEDDEDSDRSEEDEDEEDDEDSSDEDEEDQYDDDVEFDDDEDEDSYDDDSLDEDKYNKIMDDYEDLYEN